MLIFCTLTTAPCERLQGLHKFDEKTGNCEPATVNGYYTHYPFTVRQPFLMVSTLSACFMVEGLWATMMVVLS